MYLAIFPDRINMLSIRNMNLNNCYAMVLVGNLVLMLFENDYGFYNSFTMLFKLSNFP